MIEKKVGNVTLLMSEQVDGPRIQILIGATTVRHVWRNDPIPDFGPEITAAIEDLRKPLAGNECWGPNGERFRFELRDADGAGVAKGGSDEEWFHEACIPTSEAWRQVMVALRIWSEKERARWGTVRKRDAAHVTLDGKLDCYGFVDADGWNAGDNSGNVPEWFKNKTWAEYEAMVRERKPKKPSERLKEPFMGPSSPYCKELWSILDELAEKVGGL